MGEKDDREALHRIEIVGRKSLCLEGVTDVETFDEKRLFLKTNMGNLQVRGSDFHIRLLNLEDGRLEVEGEVYSLEYLKGESGQKNLLRKLFK